MPDYPDNIQVIQSGVPNHNAGGPPIYDHLVDTNTGQHYWVVNETAQSNYEYGQSPMGQYASGVGTSGAPWGGGGVTSYVPDLTFSTFDSSLMNEQWGGLNASAQRALTSQGAIQSQGASGAVGSRQELQRMLESYKGRKSLIQSAQRQKAIYTIDRFDGGLNLNKSPRDLADWEACSLNELTPSKIGRLVRLGDFKTTSKTLTAADATWQSGNQNYGIHYLSMSNSIDGSGDPETGSTSNYIAVLDDDGSGTDQEIHLIESGSNDKKTIVTALGTGCKPVFHNADNRVYISDANFSSGTTKTYVGGMVDRRKLFPFDNSASYNITGDSHSFAAQDLYHAPPTKGLADSNIMVTGTQTDSTQIASLTNLMNTAASSGGTQHHGIYMNVNFENITSEDVSGTGWGGVDSTGTGESKYYKIYASFLYDNGSETKLTDVTSNDNAVGDDVIKATTTDDMIYQKMVIKQCIIDGAGIVSSNPRIHGARFYYTETDSSGNQIGDDKYLFAELDFRYGLKLISEFGNWNEFEDDNDGSAHSLTTAIQVNNAANANDDTSADGTLSIPSPPTAFTYYSQNLFHQEELKSDLMWKCSTMGNGIAFIGNIKYDGVEYSDVMLYSGAGETDSGSAYPMWGTFPVDSNRIDIPGAAGGITALKWINNKVLQFRTNSMYLIDVKDVLSPSIDGVYQGMGVSGQYAVTETPFGVAWVNGSGAYAYNTRDDSVKSLTIGRLDDEDFGADDDTKIGYDDRSKLLIIGNYTKAQAGVNGYHYAYSFVTDSWCTWDTNKADVPQSNFAIDHDGYLTGYLSDYIKRWNSIATTHVAVEYITKDIDFGKPNLDKRLYTLYISYTGGADQSGMNVYFRVNGKEGSDLSSGWYQLETIQDYTDPYFTTESSAWNDSAGAPVTGDPTVNLDTGLNSTSTGEVQKLAKINLRNLGTTDTVDDTDTSVATFPKDYLKFARSIQFKIAGTASEAFEINDISLVYKEKRIK